MSIQTRPPLFSRQGDLLGMWPRQYDLARHDIVRMSYYTNGHVEGRGNECAICCEEMTPDAETVTHCECLNAFHEVCFDSWVTRNTDVLAAEPQPSKCPMCNGRMWPWVIATVPISPAMEAARIEARRAAIEARGHAAIVGHMQQPVFPVQDEAGLWHAAPGFHLVHLHVHGRGAETHTVIRDPGQSIQYADAAILRVRTEATAATEDAARNAERYDLEIAAMEAEGNQDAATMERILTHMRADTTRMEGLHDRLQRMLRERAELNDGIRRRVSWAG